MNFVSHPSLQCMSVCGLEDQLLCCAFVSRFSMPKTPLRELRPELFPYPGENDEFTFDFDMSDSDPDSDGNVCDR